MCEWEGGPGRARKINACHAQTRAHPHTHTHMQMFFFVGFRCTNSSSGANIPTVATRPHGQGPPRVSYSGENFPDGGAGGGGVRSMNTPRTHKRTRSSMPHRTLSREETPLSGPAPPVSRKYVNSMVKTLQLDSQCGLNPGLVNLFSPVEWASRVRARIHSGAINM